MKLLEGKTAVVTGGARGIGRAIVLAFANQGANIAFSDLALDENTAALETELTKLGVKSKAYASNAANYDDSQSFIDQVAAEFGSIDILVNNAGITRDNFADAHDRSRLGFGD